MTWLNFHRQVLMIRKIMREDDPNSGLYTLPGGKLKEHERGLNPHGRLEAAVRETEEETGLTLVHPRLAGVVLFNNFEREFDHWKKPEDYLVYMVAARKYRGQLKLQTDEGTPLWVNEENITGVSKNIGDERMYEWLRDGRFFIGNIKHKGRVLDEEGTFVDYF